MSSASPLAIPPMLALHAHPHDWLLRSRFEVVLGTRVPVSSPSLALPTRAYTLHVGLEGEAGVPFDAAREATGEPKPKAPVPVPGSVAEWVVVVANEAPKKGGGHSLGAAGLATLRGAQTAASLLSLPGAEGARVRLVFSKALEAVLAAQAEDFLVGLLHRGVNLKAGVLENSGARLQSKAIVELPEGVFPAVALASARALHGAMVVARSLVNMPGSALNPSSYEVFLRDLVKAECAQAGAPNHVGIEVLQADALAHQGCHLICAVGRGSPHQPRIAKLTYVPSDAGRATKHVAIVGKGITFDTGGLDMKPSNFMRNMKKDMGGSASALGSFLALVRRGAPVRLTCWLAIAENSVSGDAMRPGDVYRARNGLTVEIDNTDAEGRLVLADTLCLAAEEKPDWIIDLATLTGAARTALGGAVDALFSNNQSLSDLVFRTGLEKGDPVWPLPLVDEYESGLESSVADLVNCAASPQGGAITAALFLRRFVGGVPWCHIDTYMWTDKAGELYAEAGATAKCVRLVEASVRAFAGGDFGSLV